VWSLGITLIEMADGIPPLGDINPFRALRMIPDNPPPTLAHPDKFSKEMNNFIARCLVKDPQRRPSSIELLMVYGPTHTLALTLLILLLLLLLIIMTMMCATKGSILPRHQRPRGLQAIDP